MIKHGMCYSKLYRVWADMKRRCNNPLNMSYQWYGAKGIKVCEEWNLFIPFMRWAKSNGYRDDLTIERRDNDRGYFPENCRWIPISEQSRNTKRSIFLTYNGKTMCLKDWATEIGISRQSLTKRLKKHSVVKALTL